jgi:hypothetical protein
MTHTDPNAITTTDCVFNTILDFLLPFFLVGARGNQDVATAAIRELIDTYNAGNPMELDLVGRIIGFSIASLDNLRLSMTAGLSDTKVLRYRCNAITLCRSSNTARTMLEATQAGRPVRQATPRPTVAAAPPAPKPVPVVQAPKPAPQAQAPVIPQLPNGGISKFPMDIEAMKRDARIKMAAFSKSGAAAPIAILDPAAAIRAAVRAAVTSERRVASA